jgi:hypothetical protein
MIKQCSIYFIFFCTITIANTTSLINEHNDIYCRLEHLWVILYGSHHPLRDYLAAYKQGLQRYQSLPLSNNTSRAVDPATEMMINDLQLQLNAIKEKAHTLLNQYTITPVTPQNTTNSPLTLITNPPAYRAKPTDEASSESTDVTLQQLLNALQQLQTTQPTYNTNSLLKQQAILFISGIICLAIATCLTHYTLSPNCRRLKRTVNNLQHEYEAPHPLQDGSFVCGKTGILDEVAHLKALLAAAETKAV